MKVLQRKTSYKISHILATVAFVFSTVVSPLLSATTVAAATLPQVSTGAESACAVVNSQVKCWGNNDNGQLGIGTTGGIKTNPTAVYTKTTVTPAQTTQSCNLIVFCTTDTVSPEIPASAMGGKKVTKVSVGAKHVCALANASVYCWGDNSSGQLGRSGGDTSVPVAVYVSSSSALQGKEVIDITASNNYTCALASDGSVACWGNNQYGQLGNGSFNSSSIPTAVDKTGELAGRRGVQLAKVAGYSMCVLARVATDSSANSTGAPYCWGRGMGRDAVPASSTTTLTTCSPVTNSSSAPVYFNANRPVRIAGNVSFSLVDGDTYMTGLAVDNSTYYWGMHGYKGTVTYRAVGTVGSIGETDKNIADTGVYFMQKAIILASVSTDKAKQNNQPGADKNKNLNSNNNAVQQATKTSNQYNPNGATSRSSGYTSSQTTGGSYAGVASPGYYPPPSANVGNNKNDAPTPTPGTGGGRGGPSTTPTSVTPTPTPTPKLVADPPPSVTPPPTPTPKLVADPPPSVTPPPTPTPKLVADPPPSVTPPPPPPPSTPGCKATIYNVETAFTELGTLNATRHASSSLTNSGISTLSGNVVDNLFCAVKVAGAVYCDANGTSVTEGQTGSNFTQSCTQSNSFTICVLPPTGPQSVYTDGWMSGKTIVSLSTEPSGYTCAVSNDNSVGCWGMNNLGQLGVGDTTNKKVPTKVNL